MRQTDVRSSVALRSVVLCLTLGAALAAGCLQIEVSIQMQEEGGATVTERVRLSAKLLELDRQTPEDKRITRLLDRAAIDERVKQMGKGATVASHKVSELADGARESIAVYQIPDIEDLRLINPYLHESSPARTMRIRFEPIYKVVHSYHALGEMMLYLVPAEQPRRGDGEKGTPPPPPTPAALQMFRDLQPVFIDMMEGVEVKLRLIHTKPISSGHIRGRQSASKVIDLISFTDKDLDAFGRNFLENEELMLSILQLDFNAENIADHTQGFPNNMTLPVFLGRKPYGSGRFRVKPTQALFKKYFAGRPKSEGGDVPDK